MTTQPAKAPRRRPKLSAPAAEPAATFQWEPFSAIVREWLPLARKQYEERAYLLDEVPMDVDFDRYFLQALAGILHCMTVRVDGLLVGYAFALIGPHLHHNSTIFSIEDMYWLDPLYREGLTGYKMLKHFDEGLRERDVEVSWISESLLRERTVAPMLERLGYKPIQTIWAKVFK